MLVGQALFFKPLLELGVVDLLERVLEGAVVDLENRVLRRQVNRVIAAERIREARAGEALDRRIEVEHAHGNAAALGLDHFTADRLAAAIGRPADRDRAGAWKLEILRP